MLTLNGELQKYQKQIAAVRAAFEWLSDGNMEAASALIFIKGNYKQWADIFTWLKVNRLRGQALADLFKNESPDGGGYHMGVTLILSRMKGHKHQIEGIKINELR